MAASATFALKADVWFRRGRLDMVSPDSQAIGCLLSGRNSTYRPVQNSGTGSTFTVSDLCRLVYGVAVIERRHRSAVNRALRIVLRHTDWSQSRLWNDGVWGRTPETLIFHGDERAAYQRHMSRNQLAR